MHPLIVLCALAQLPAYPGAVHTRIGDDLEVGGELYRIAYFTTTDSPLEVAQYFLRDWRSHGYPTTAVGDFRAEGVVSAFSTREGIQRAVVVRVEGAKTLAFTLLKDQTTRAPQGERAEAVKLDPAEVRRRLIDELKRAELALTRQPQHPRLPNRLAGEGATAAHNIR